MTQSSQVIDRADTLGILGGGQLGRMLVHAAQRMGLATCVLDPDAQAGAMRASDTALVAAYDDTAALDDLASRCAHITTEFENVPASSLQHLAQNGQTQVAPSASAVNIAQDRVREKQFFEACAAKSTQAILPVPWAKIVDLSDIDAAPDDCFAGILKTNRLGYDGKGQQRVSNRSQLLQAWDGVGRVACVLEKSVDLALECSVIVARSRSGEIVRLPLQVNTHRGGVLFETRVGMPLKPGLTEDLSTFSALVSDFIGFDATENIASELNYVGVLCVEFFVLTNGRVCVNEMAPRPHNSGHHSIESCDVSQFELQARAVMDWPLIQPQQRCPAIMLNILGDVWFGTGGALREPPWAELLRLSGVHLHLYGKRDARRGRKMGHVTITALDTATVEARCAQVKSILGLERA